MDWRCLFYQQPNGGRMEFNIGDPVMHWTYGMGHIVHMEERNINGKNDLYYEVSIKDITLWVPNDKNITNRLRPPTSADEFVHLFSILSAPGEPLPENRQERKLQIVERLKDGRAETLCRVIRDLVEYQRVRPLNETDQSLMKRVHNALIGEWVFALSVSIMDAEKELRRILTSGKMSEQVRI
jgi:RNA polymerase-interacting CarD/CdnL/TRCF family regulator